MTSPTKTSTIFNNKPLLRVRIPRIFMVSGHPITNLAAFCASKIRVPNYGNTPLTISRPLAFSLNISGVFSFKVPVALSSHLRVANVPTLNATYNRTPIWFINNDFFAHFTGKLTSIFSFVMRCKSNVRCSVFLNLLTGPFQSDVPMRRHAFAQMAWPHPLYANVLHPCPDRSSRYSKHFSNSFRAMFFNNIEQLKLFFCWLHLANISQKPVNRKHFCIATNTWKRSALSTC